MNNAKLPDWPRKVAQYLPILHESIGKQSGGLRDLFLLNDRVDAGNHLYENRGIPDKSIQARLEGKSENRWLSEQLPGVRLQFLELHRAE